MNTFVIPACKLILNRFSFGYCGNRSPVVNVNSGAERGIKCSSSGPQRVTSPQVYVVTLSGNILCVRVCMSVCV